MKGAQHGFFNISYEEFLKIRVDEAREDGIEEGLERGIKTGIKRGIKEGTEKGIAGLVLDYREEGFSQEKILGKLEKRFDLSKEQARAYYEQYAQ